MNSFISRERSGLSPYLEGKGKYFLKIILANLQRNKNLNSNSVWSPNIKKRGLFDLLDKKNASKYLPKK